MKKYYVVRGVCSIKEVEVEKETKSFVVIKGYNYKTAKDTKYHEIFDTFEEAKEALRNAIEDEIKNHRKRIDELLLKLENVDGIEND